MIDRRFEGNDATPIVAHKVATLDPYGIEKTYDVVTEKRSADAYSRFFGTPETAIVGSVRPKAGLPARLELMAPLMRSLREAMDENNRFPIEWTTCKVMHAKVSRLYVMRFNHFQIAPAVIVR